MERGELLRKVAPCGLICYTCTAAKDGAIQSHSQALLRLLESFDGFAERFSTYEPRLNKYPDFKEVLQLLSEASCEGCRSGHCPYPGCRVSPCVAQKGVDFCFECEDFPCEKVNFPETLRAKWIEANERMREVGAETYLNETKDTSHYT